MTWNMARTAKSTIPVEVHSETRILLMQVSVVYTLLQDAVFRQCPPKALHFLVSVLPKIPSAIIVTFPRLLRKSRQSGGISSFKCYRVQCYTAESLNILLMLPKLARLPVASLVSIRGSGMEHLQSI